MEVSNKEFERLRKDQKHSELMLKLDEILNKIQNEDSENIETLILLTKYFEDLKETITNNPVQVTSPEVNINNAGLVDEIENFTNKIATAIETMSNKIEKRPTEWKFTVHRDKVGYIEEVTAISK